MFIDPHNSGNAFSWANRLPGRVENLEVYRDLEAAERAFIRIQQSYFSGKVRSFEEIDPQQRRREKLTFVVVADFPHGFSSDPRSLEVLKRIANNGARAGTYVLLHLNREAELPRGFDLNQFKNLELVPLHPPEKPARGTLVFSPDAAPLPEVQEKLFAQIEAVPVVVAELGFNEIVGVAPADWWKASAAERFETPLGLRGGDEDLLKLGFGQATDGRSINHGIIGGKAGSGKSNVFHVIILGLAQRYAPDQLRFYLVDGKDGVEFAPYRDLPHVEVLSLNTAPQLSRSLVAELVTEIERRNVLFQGLGVKKLSEYLANGAPHGPLPRLLLVIDEYQELFEQDEQDEASQLLLKLAKQGRSVGIHFLLGSQQFGAPGMRFQKEIFAEIDVRLALMFEPAAITQMSEFDRQGKEAIRALDGPGKVVLNDRLGKDGANATGVVARVSSALQAELVQRLAEHARQKHPVLLAPIVFEGLSQPALSANPALKNLATAAATATPASVEGAMRRPAAGAPLQEWYATESPRIGWLGQELNVHGFAHVVLKRRAGDNLLVVGQGDNARHGMLLAWVSSMMLNLPAGETQAWVLDRTVQSSPWGQCWPRWIKELAEPLGWPVHHATDHAGCEHLLEELAGELTRRKAMSDDELQRAPTYLIGLIEPERWDGLLRKPDAIGVLTESASGMKLRALCAEGPAKGLHVVATAGAWRSLSAVIDERRGLPAFRHRVALQMSDDESFTVFSSRKAAQLRAAGHAGGPTLALMLDVDSGRPVAFKPYVASSAGAAHTRQAVLDDLPALLRWAKGSA